MWVSLSAVLWLIEALGLSHESQEVPLTSPRPAAGAPSRLLCADPVVTRVFTALGEITQTCICRLV